jgi:hypothetical protein
MAQFSAQNGAFTPAAHATNMNNWTLEADTLGDIGRVKMFSWGGRGTTSTGYRTRWARATTNGTSTFTSLTGNATNPSATALCRCGTFVTASIGGADPAANLFAQDWNVLGGGGVIILPIGGEWMVAGVSAPYAQVSCGNIAGADANLSSYGVTWEE